MSRYLKPRDHGYLMEAAACVKVLGDLSRIEAKYARTVEKEGAVRQAEFEKVMQYHSEREIQDDFGWGFITEAQYDRYRLLFQQGQAAMEQLPPTKSELALRLVRRIMADIDADRREWEFSALSPEDQRAGTGAGRAVAERVEAKNRGAETEARYHRGRRGHRGRVITISRTVYQGGYG